MVPPVLASQGRLSQVFLNLLINAAQAIGEGSAKDHEIRIRTRLDGDQVVVEVQDTGPGVAPEHRSRLFNPFFTTKPAGVGSGLGLAVCRAIVESHGGSVDFDGTVERGACFSVRLPRAPERRPSDEDVPSAVPAAPLPRLRVLVVDDDREVAATLRDMLCAQHDVTIVGSGAEARAVLEGGLLVDVVLCDLMMAEVSGEELHAFLVENRPDLARRTVFISGGAFTERARVFLQRIDNPTLDKPVDPVQLQDAVLAAGRAR